MSSRHRPGARVTWRELFPQVDAKQFEILVRLPTGARIERTERTIVRIEETLLAELGTPEWTLLVDLLHYWDDAGQRAILAKLSGSLAPGSRLLFRDGCRDSAEAHWLTHALERFATWTGFTRGHGGLHFRTRAGWQELLESAGFVTEATYPEFGSLSNLVLICRVESPA